jgi:hypothetical protein
MAPVRSISLPIAIAWDHRQSREAVGFRNDHRNLLQQLF